MGLHSFSCAAKLGLDAQNGEIVLDPDIPEEIGRIRPDRHTRVRQPLGRWKRRETRYNGRLAPDSSTNSHAACVGSVKERGRE